MSIISISISISISIVIMPARRIRKIESLGVLSHSEITTYLRFKINAIGGPNFGEMFPLFCGIRGRMAPRNAAEVQCRMF